MIHRSASIPRCSHLFSRVNLLDAVADLIGDEISLNPICHVRIKPQQVVMDRSTISNEFSRNLNQNSSISQSPLISGQRPGQEL